MKLNPPKRYLPLGCLLVLAASAVCRAQDAGLVEPGVAAEAEAAAGVYEVQKPFYKRWFSLEAVTDTVPGAVLEQVDNWPKEWRRTRPGFEKRLGSLAGQFFLGVMFEDAVKAIHPEDTRYRRMGKGNFFGRTGHAIAGTVTARRPDGGRSFAWSSAANAYGSWAVATLWSPRQYRGAVSILEWGTEGMGTMAGFNFAREFWPDVRSLFHKSR